MAVNLGITHLALGPMLQAELGVPVFVEHDARAAALWLSGQAADRSAPVRGERRLPGDRDRDLGRRRPRRGPAPRRQQLCRRGGPRRRRSRRRRLRVRPPRLPRDDRRRAGDRSSGRRRDRGRPKHRPVAGFDGRGRLPRRVRRRRGRGRDRRPGGRPPGPGDPIARPDPRRRARRDRRRRGGRRTRPSRSTPTRTLHASARPRRSSGPPWAMRASSCWRQPRHPPHAERQRSRATGSACLNERGWASDNANGGLSAGMG